MKNDMLAAREFLVEELRKELLGPGSENSIPDAENEVITDLPESRYSVGILFPQMNSINTENDDPSSPDANTEDSEAEEPRSAIEGDAGERGEDHVVPETTEIKTLDDDISLATQRKPSSMGFTFFSATDMERLIVRLEFGTYRKAKMEDCQVRFTPPHEGYRLPQRLEQYVYMDSGYLRLCLPLKRKDVGKFFSTDEIGDVFLQDYLYKLSSQFESKGFKREPHKTEIVVNFNNSKAVEVTEIDGKPLKFTAIKRKNSSGLTAVTVMLVNMAEGKYDGTNSIFQPQVRIATLNNHFTFEEYSKYRTLNIDDTEEQNLALLYRGKKVFATGHGTSVDWDIDSAGNGCLWNEFLPVADVPQMDFESEDAQIGAQTFSMKFMSDLHVCDKEEKIEQLHSLVASYSQWIDKISSEAELLSEFYLSAAKENISRCREASARMTRGLTYLRNNSNAYTAFELANRAMYMQRIHGFIQHKDSMPNDESLQTILHEINYYEAENYYYGGAEPKWRPFQLAFLLQSIASIVDDDGDERNLVDLIWFPTGGGKTEAYLGLTAFTIFYRKLENQLQSAGTAVIMRYTLRLLAAQQFTRASILICACEAIRRDSCGARKYPSYPLGNDEINIGLWIGSEHTPNKNDKAKVHLNELNKASGYNLREQKSRHNKFQILKCPWCGTKLVKEVDGAGKLSGRWGYQMDSCSIF